MVNRLIRLAPNLIDVRHMRVDSPSDGLDASAATKLVASFRSEWQYRRVPASGHVLGMTAQRVVGMMADDEPQIPPRGLKSLVEETIRV